MPCQRSCSQDTAELSLESKYFYSISNVTHNTMSKWSKDWAPAHLEKENQDLHNHTGWKYSKTLKVALPPLQSNSLEQWSESCTWDKRQSKKAMQKHSRCQYKSSTSKKVINTAQQTMTLSLNVLHLGGKLDHYPNPRKTVIGPENDLSNPSTLHSANIGGIEAIW